MPPLPILQSPAAGAKNGRAYFYRANAYNDQKEYAMAVQDYDHAIELDPKNPFAYFYRGNANNAQQKYADAITDITKAIAIAPMPICTTTGPMQKAALATMPARLKILQKPSL
jgi:tetratricopeptide (TPR) repeat protein